MTFLSVECTYLSTAINSQMKTYFILSQLCFIVLLFIIVCIVLCLCEHTVESMISSPFNSFERTFRFWKFSRRTDTFWKCVQHRDTQMGDKFIPFQHGRLSYLQNPEIEDMYRARAYWRLCIINVQGSVPAQKHCGSSIHFEPQGKLLGTKTPYLYCHNI